MIGTALGVGKEIWAFMAEPKLYTVTNAKTVLMAVLFRTARRIKLIRHDAPTCSSM